jgi:glycosyltransferase involved in cell wall biosynthesis
LRYRNRVEPPAIPALQGVQPLRVLALTKYGRRAASSRHRFYDYIPLLACKSVTVTMAPLLSDAYVQGLFAKQRLDLADVTRSFLRRLAALFTSHRYDLLWIEGELFPRFPGLAERLLSLLDYPYVVDLDDAIFHTYDQHPYRLVRHFLGRKVDIVLGNAAAVVAGNAYLAERAKQAGASRVVVVPTCVDERKYAEVARPAPRSELTFGWIGSPATENYLTTIAQELEALCRSLPASLRLIGAAPDGTRFPTAIRRPWSEQTEIEEIAACDIGLAPLLGIPWDRGKCSLKAVQYMSVGIPVLAAKFGAQPDIVRHGETGFLFADREEFTFFARELAHDPELRARLGKAGREHVAENYSIHHWVDTLKETFASSVR